MSIFDSPKARSLLERLPEILQIVGATMQDSSSGGRTQQLAGVSEQMRRRRGEMAARQLQEALAGAMAPPQAAALGINPAQGAIGPPQAMPIGPPAFDPRQAAMGPPADAPAMAGGRPDRGAAMKALMAAQAAGVDVAPYAALFDSGAKQEALQQYLQGVPEQDRGLAEMDPSGYAKDQLGQRTRKIIEADDGSVLSIDPRTGDAKVLFKGQRKAPAGFTYDEDGQLALDPGYLAGIGQLSETRRKAITRNPMPKASPGRRSSGSSGLPAGYQLLP